MDDRRFDALSRVVGAGATRRGALGLLAGVAGSGPSEAEGDASRASRRSKNKGEASA